MARHSFSKNIFCASLIVIQALAILPATNVFAMQNSNVNVSANKQINDNQWVMFGFEDEEELKANIIQNKEFIKNWADVADNLGFAWCSGTNSKFVGQDFGFTKVIENGKSVYILKANYNSNDPYADGYRADERLEMKISNIRFVVDPSTIEFGKAKITEEKPLLAASSYATNSGNTEDSVNMNFNYSSTVSSSKTDNFKFSEGIGVKTTFQTGVPFLFEGKLETSFNFSADQGWSNTKGESKTTSIATQYSAKVPASSKRLIKLVSVQRKSEVPYSAKMYMEYDITFNGFLKWSGNAHKNHPDDRPIVSIKFGGKNNMSATEHILDMYKHRNINGYSDWDWNWMIEKYGKDYVDNIINDACKIRYGGVLTGVFTGIDGTHVDVKANKPKKLNSKNRKKRSLDNSNIRIEDFKTYDIPNMKVNSLTVDKDGISEILNP